MRPIITGQGLNSMRICMYTETALPKMGGQEVVVDALARQFLARGHDVAVLAPYPRAHLCVNDSVLPYRVFRHRRFYSTRYLVSWYRRYLCRLHARHRFDVLHCHSIYPQGYLAGLSRATLGLPIVITSHGGDVNPKSIRLAKPGLHERYVEGLRAADALVAISRSTREGYLRLWPGARNIVDIPNGVDLDAFASAARLPNGMDAAIRPEKYLLFLGRLQPRKGVDVLLEALARVPGDGGVQLVVAGNGDSREELEALSQQLGLGQRVRFVGQVTGRAKVWLLQNALATVIPSRSWEAFCLVTLESYAAGRPVIASDLPGLADNVQDGRTGFVVPPESPEHLAHPLEQALTKPELMREMGQACRRRASECGWRAVASDHIELYEQLLDGWPPRAFRKEAQESLTLAKSAS
jgi:teichuronic acid biosynthesis glycosyltransferase TuaC